MKPPFKEVIAAVILMLSLVPSLARREYRKEMGKGLRFPSGSPTGFKQRARLYR